MFLTDYLRTVAQRLKIDPDSLDERQVPFKNRLIDKINEAVREIGESHNWPFLRVTSDLQTVGSTTLSCTVTNGSNSVTASSGLTASMQGWYFQPPTGLNWYRIAYVDVTNQIAYLETPMIEATQTGNSTFWKRFYYLYSQVNILTDFGNWIVNGELVAETQRQLTEINPNKVVFGQPQNFSQYGVDPYTTIYSTGSVTIPKDSNVMTGLGSSWLANAGPGDIITVKNFITRVRRVEQDTRIILFNYCPFDLSSSSSYTIEKETPIGFQFYPSPDKAYVYPYTYFRKVFNLVHENKDRSEFPEQFDLAIMDLAEAGMMRDMKDPNWDKKRQEASARVGDIQRRATYLNQPRTRQFYPRIPMRTGYYGNSR